jgi:putative spermidine/putrescine transport system ATP-binding protein
MTYQAQIESPLTSEHGEISSQTPQPQIGSLKISDLKKSYGSLQALKGVSLDIRPGEFIALLGPSGCGKTTLLGAIAGFVDIDEGKVEIDGKELPKNLPPYERNLGVVFQHYALFPHLTVKRNIAFPLEIRRCPTEEIESRVEQALAMVDLSEFSERLPRELSGGQQQRVALARSLVYSPPILLLDEPLGALDRRLRDAMQTELKDLHQRLGTTFIYVTHDQDEALAMADRVVVMKNGLIEQQGTPLELYEKPVNSFVAKFVGECNVLPGEWRQHQERWALIEPVTGLPLHFAPNNRDLQGVTKVAIRPEWLHVDVGDNRTPNPSISCRIVQTRFHGSNTLVNLESPLGELMVQIPHRLRTKVDIKSGELPIYWDPAETVLLAT